ncbi:MAG TPA: prephenate dehydrogenase/arogenate dehydrogenase family protein [Terriglobales bacterium]|nr:prephenate dehydrogenase/arogenate dehydrogenase family protein [Terriglobales bacterium]
MSAIRQITIIGTGLIGGSFALAIRKAGFKGYIVGCDREPVLAQARERGAVDRAYIDPGEATQGSDVTLLATPVGSIIDLVERIGPTMPPDSLIADVGSTKAEIAARARAIFGQSAGTRFIPGHPMAGKERGGIAQAYPDLFRGAAWIITPLGEISPAGAGFLELVAGTGAHIVSMEPERHDRLCAWFSHLPQMLAIALAASLADEFADDPDALELAGPALREMTRTAASPYALWRDIALTNRGNLQDALLQLEQCLAHLRENLSTRELEGQFDLANRFRKSLTTGDTENIEKENKKTGPAGPFSS